MLLSSEKIWLGLWRGYPGPFLNLQQMPAYLADVKTQGMGSQAAININFGSFIDLLTLPSPRAMLLGHSCHPLVLKEETKQPNNVAPVVSGVLIKEVAKELFLFQSTRNIKPLN